MYGVVMNVWVEEKCKGNRKAERREETERSYIMCVGCENEMGREREVEE